MWRAALALSILLSAVLCALAPARAQEREWTYASGGKFKAKLVRELDGEAIFLKDRQFLSVPLDDLSEADRKLVLAAAEGKSEAKSADDEPSQAPRRGKDLDSDGKVESLVKPKTAVVNRDWTDTSGNRTYGKFVRVYERNVVLLRGTRPATIPYDDLSPADQAYVNQVLTERGEQPLDTIATETTVTPADSATAAPNFQPLAEQPEYSDTPASGGNARGSQFFDELRERQEERRREQEEYAAQNPAPPMDTPADDSAAGGPTVIFTEPPIAPPDGPGHADPPLGNRHASGGLRIDGKTVAEMRPVLIMAGVLLGLFALLGVIVFIATTIASSNTPRHQRRLY
jgi:hypothetical protein